MVQYRRTQQSVEEFKNELLLQITTQRESSKVLVFETGENGPLFIEVKLKALGIK